MGAALAVLTACGAAAPRRRAPTQSALATVAAPAVATAAAVSQESASPASDEVAALEDRVAALAHEERFRDAFACLDAAAAAADDVRLLALRAELLRDVGRRHESLAVWRQIVARVGVEQVDSASLFGIAVLERLEGERNACLRTLAELRRRPSDEPWLTAHAAEVRQLHAETANGLPITRISARDLLGNLRGAPDASNRAGALAVLLRTDASDPSAGAGVRRRAVMVAVGDADPLVRAAGVAAWEADDDVAADFCAGALADGSAVVRAAAVPHARRLAPAAAIPLLLAAMADESDATVFAVMHSALAEVSGIAGMAPPLAAGSAAERTACVTLWQARLGAAARTGGR